MKDKKQSKRTELEASLKRVAKKDAIAGEAMKPRVLIWKSESSTPAKERWSSYDITTNVYTANFAVSFDAAMKAAAKAFPGHRIDHDAGMTDAKAKGIVKKYKALDVAARTEAARTDFKGAPASAKGGAIKSPGKKAPTVPEENKEEQIEDLLQQLREATDPDDKKKIRRKLRARGHRGGLGGGTGPKPAGTKKPAPKKAKVEDPEDVDLDEDEDFDADDDD